MMMRRRSLIAATAATIAAGRSLLPARARAAEPGVGAESLLFGQAAPLDGPAAALGRGMQQGIAAAFAEANRAGGVKRRRLDLLSLDDGYDPNRTIEVTRRLIETERVFALLGPVGTPTSAAALPLATDAGVPFVGPFTGAEFLRTPHKPNVVNVRASYFQETEAMIEHLTRDLGITRIGVFYQDDAFGRAGLAGVQKALDRRGLPLAAEGLYERNTTAVKRAVLLIRKARPEAVVMVGAYKPCAAFIKVTRQVGLDAVFINISFVGGDALAQELGEAGAGVAVTQVVPFPRDPSLDVVRRYQAALAAVAPGATPGFVSLEGYLVGRLVVAALERMEGEPTRQGFLGAIANGGPFDLGGMTLRFGPTNNQGSSAVYLTIVQPDGTLKPVTTLASAAG